MVWLRSDLGDRAGREQLLRQLSAKRLVRGRNNNGPRRRGKAEAEAGAGRWRQRFTPLESIALAMAEPPREGGKVTRQTHGEVEPSLRTYPFLHRNWGAQERAFFLSVQKLGHY